jgi:hypothetical protein
VDAIAGLLAGPLQPTRAGRGAFGQPPRRAVQLRPKVERDAHHPPATDPPLGPTLRPQRSGGLRSGSDSRATSRPPRGARTPAAPVGLLRWAPGPPPPARAVSHADFRSGSPDHAVSRYSRSRAGGSPPGSAQPDGHTRAVASRAPLHPWNIPVIASDAPTHPAARSGSPTEPGPTLAGSVTRPRPPADSPTNEEVPQRDPASQVFGTRPEIRGPRQSRSTASAPLAARAGGGAPVHGGQLPGLPRPGPSTGARSLAQPDQSDATPVTPTPRAVRNAGSAPRRLRPREHAPAPAQPPAPGASSVTPAPYGQSSGERPATTEQVVSATAPRPAPPPRYAETVLPTPAVPVREPEVRPGAAAVRIEIGRVDICTVPRISPTGSGTLPVQPARPHVIDPGIRVGDGQW